MSDYPWIRKWGQRMGSFRYFIDDQVALARADNAPQNAIYRHRDGTWSTTEDITSSTTRRELGLPPLPEPSVHLRAAELLLATLRTLHSLGVDGAVSMYADGTTYVSVSGNEPALTPYAHVHTALLRALTALCDDHDRAEELLFLCHNNEEGVADNLRQLQARWAED